MGIPSLGPVPSIGHSMGHVPSTVGGCGLHTLASLEYLCFTFSISSRPIRCSGESVAIRSGDTLSPLSAAASEAALKRWEGSGNPAAAAMAAASSPPMELYLMSVDAVG